MIVQVLPVAIYTQDTLDEVFTMTVGAYAWAAVVPTNDLVKPTRGADCVLKEAAALTKVSFGAIAAAIVALTLY